MFTYETRTLQNEMKMKFHIQNGKNHSNSQFSSSLSNSFSKYNKKLPCVSI